jgi:hypothetical protein
LVTQASLPNPTSISDLNQLETVRKALEDAYDINSPLRAAVYDFGSLQLDTEHEEQK